MSRVLRPDCQFGEHSWCSIAEVVVEGVVIVKARRCDCPCHKEKLDEALPAVRPADHR